MSLLFLEGFEDNHTKSDRTMGGQWNSDTGSATGGNPRTGSGEGRVGGGLGWDIILDAADRHATLIFGCAWYSTSLPANDITPFFQFQSDSQGTTHLAFNVSAAGEIIVKRGGASGTELGRSGSVFSVSTWHYIEVKAVLDDSAGSVTIRVDNTEVLDLTGVDTKNGGTNATFDSIDFPTSNPVRGLDDVYVANGAGSDANDFLGDLRIIRIDPNGNGSSSDLVGSDGNSTDNYLQVDEATPSATDYNGSGTPGDKDLYAYEDPTGTITGSCVGIEIRSFVLKSDAGAIGGRPLMFRGATEAQGDAAVLATTATLDRWVMATDPIAAGDFTLANLDDTEFGWEVTA